MKTLLRQLLKLMKRKCLYRLKINKLRMRLSKKHILLRMFKRNHLLLVSMKLLNPKKKSIKTLKSKRIKLNRYRLSKIII